MFRSLRGVGVGLGATFLRFVCGVHFVDPFCDNIRLELLHPIVCKQQEGTDEFEHL